MNMLNIENGYTQSIPDNEIQILTFSLWGIRLAVDTESIYKMVSTEEAAKQGYEIFNIHEKFKSEREDYPCSYESARVLLIKKGEDELVGVMIDNPEEIFTVEIAAIKPVPGLIEASIKTSMVWGVIVQKGEIILLVDFYKIL